jgi:hypothetical protein
MTYNDKGVLKEIWVGGTNTKIVFENEPGMGSGQ